MTDNTPAAPPKRTMRLRLPKRKTAMPKPRRRKRRTVLLLGLLLILLPVLGFTFIVAPGPLTEDATVIAAHGMSVHEIADNLASAGAIYNVWPFRIAAEAIAYNALKAGEYRLSAHESIADIVLQMHEGRSVIRWFTVAEGLTSAEITHLLQSDLALSGEIAAPPAEGSLLPETYRYSYGDSRIGIVNRMQKAMTETLGELWAARDPAVMLKNPAEAVTLASVIEKETGKANERPRIAGVFYNRLHQNMRLQSDPTVIYALTNGHPPLNRELVHDDLAFQSPYNTYANDGLPPAPICNPGRAALTAALHPETNSFLYFVADGTGGHAFARTLAEHNANVTKWNELKTKKP